MITITKEGKIQESVKGLSYIQEKWASALINALTLFLPGFIMRQVHVDMTKSCTEKQVYSTFKNFKKKFNEVAWTYDDHWRSSLFDRYHNSQCHASILEIKGKGYLLTTYGYIMALMLINREIKSLRPPTIIEQ